MLNLFFSSNFLHYNLFFTVLCSRSTHPWEWVLNALPWINLHYLYLKILSIFCLQIRYSYLNMINKKAILIFILVLCIDSIDLVKILFRMYVKFTEKHYDIMHLINWQFIEESKLNDLLLRLLVYINMGFLKVKKNSKISKNFSYWY